MSERLVTDIRYDSHGPKLAIPKYSDIPSTPNLQDFGNLLEPVSNLSLSDKLKAIDQKNVDKEKLSSPYITSEEVASRYTSRVFGKDQYLDPRYFDNEQIAAERQREISKFLNGGVKSISAFAQSFITSFTTTPFNYDTESAAALNTFQSNMEKWFPNYYTKQELNSNSALKGLIPLTQGWGNFWGDKVLKNIGFMGGAIASAFLIDAMVTATTGGMGLPEMLAIQVGRGAKYLGIAFKNSAKFGTALSDSNFGLLLAKQVGRGAKFEEQLMALSTGKKFLTSAKVNLSLGWSAHSESAIEAIEGLNSTRQDLINSYIEKNGDYPDVTELKKIESISKSSANIRYGLNLATIWGTNVFQFSSVFTPFKSLTTGALGDTFVFGGKNFAKKEFIDVTTRKLTSRATGYLEKGFDLLKSDLMLENISESTQEYLQYAFDISTHDFAKKKYNGDIRGTFGEYLQSQLYGLERGIKDKDGRESTLIGFLTGFAVHGSIKLANKIKGVPTDQELRDRALKSFNENTLDMLFRDVRAVDERVTHEVLLKQMDEAIKKGNVYEFKALQHQVLTNMVRTSIKLNKFDARIEQLKMLKSIETKEFFKMMNWEKDGDITEEDSVKVNMFVDSIIDKAHEIKEKADLIDSTYENPYVIKTKKGKEPKEEDVRRWRAFEDYKDTLIYQLTNVSNIESRLPKVIQDVLSAHPAVESDLINIMSNFNTASVDYINNIAKTVKALEDAIKLSTETVDSTQKLSPETKEQLKKDSQELSDLREHFERLKNAFTGINANLDEKATDPWTMNSRYYLKQFVKEYLYKKIKDVGGFEARPSDDVIEGITTGLIDLHRLKTAMNMALDENDKLRTQAGHKSFIEEMIKAADDFDLRYFDRIRDLDYRALLEDKEGSIRRLKDKILAIKDEIAKLVSDISQKEESIKVMSSEVEKLEQESIDLQEKLLTDFTEEDRVRLQEIASLINSLNEKVNNEIAELGELQEDLKTLKDDEILSREYLTALVKGLDNFKDIKAPPFKEPNFNVELISKKIEDVDKEISQIDANLLTARELQQGIDLKLSNITESSVINLDDLVKKLTVFSDSLISKEDLQRLLSEDFANDVEALTDSLKSINYDVLRLEALRQDLIKKNDYYYSLLDDSKVEDKNFITDKIEVVQDKVKVIDGILQKLRKLYERVLKLFTSLVNTEKDSARELLKKMDIAQDKKEALEKDLKKYNLKLNLTTPANITLNKVSQYLQMKYEEAKKEAYAFRDTINGALQDALNINRNKLTEQRANIEKYNSEKKELKTELRYLLELYTDAYNNFVNEANEIEELLDVEKEKESIEEEEAKILTKVEDTKSLDTRSSITMDEQVRNFFLVTGDTDDDGQGGYRAPYSVFKTNARTDERDRPDGNTSERTIRFQDFITTFGSIEAIRVFMIENALSLVLVKTPFEELATDTNHKYYDIPDDIANDKGIVLALHDANGNLVRLYKKDNVYTVDRGSNEVYRDDSFFLTEMVYNPYNWLDPTSKNNIIESRKRVFGESDEEARAKVEEELEKSVKIREDLINGTKKAHTLSMDAMSLSSGKPNFWSKVSDNKGVPVTHEDINSGRVTIYVPKKESEPYRGFTRLRGFAYVQVIDDNKVPLISVPSSTDNLTNIKINDKDILDSVAEVISYIYNLTPEEFKEKYTERNADGGYVILDELNTYLDKIFYNNTEINAANGYRVFTRFNFSFDTNLDKDGNLVSNLNKIVEIKKTRVQGGDQKVSVLPNSISPTDIEILKDKDKLASVLKDLLKDIQMNVSTETESPINIITLSDSELKITPMNYYDFLIDVGKLSIPIKLTLHNVKPMLLGRSLLFDQKAPKSGSKIQSQEGRGVPTVAVAGFNLNTILSQGKSTEQNKATTDNTNAGQNIWNRNSIMGSGNTGTPVVTEQTSEQPAVVNSIFNRNVLLGGSGVANIPSEVSNSTTEELKDITDPSLTEFPKNGDKFEHTDQITGNKVVVTANYNKVFKRTMFYYKINYKNANRAILYDVYTGLTYVLAKSKKTKKSYYKVVTTRPFRKYSGNGMYSGIYDDSKIADEGVDEEIDTSIGEFEPIDADIGDTVFIQNNDNVIPEEGRDTPASEDSNNEDPIAVPSNITPEDPNDLFSSRSEERLEGKPVTDEVINEVRRMLNDKNLNVRNLYDIYHSDGYASWNISGITLYQGANASDAYHESWHEFSQKYLTKEEKISLYKEARTKSGTFIAFDTGDKVKFSKATFLQLEEYIAREFAKFVLSGGKVIEGKMVKRKNIFEKILYLLKRLFSNERDLSLEKLFTDLYNGEISNYTKGNENIMFGPLKSAMKIADFELPHLKRIMSKLNAFSSRILLERGLSKPEGGKEIFKIADLLNKKSGIDRVDFSNRLKKDLMSFLIGEYKNYGDVISVEDGMTVFKTRSNLSNEDKKIGGNLRGIIINFDQIYEYFTRTSEFFSPYRLKSKEQEEDTEFYDTTPDDILEENYDSFLQEKEITNNRLYDSPNSEQNQDNFDPELKLFLKTLVDTDDKIDISFGIGKLVNYPYLIRNLRTLFENQLASRVYSTGNGDSIEEKLKESAKTNNVHKKMYDTFFGPNADKSLLGKFVIGFSRSTNNIIVKVVQNGGDEKTLGGRYPEETELSISPIVTFSKKQILRELSNSFKGHKLVDKSYIDLPITGVRTINQNSLERIKQAIINNETDVEVFYKRLGIDISILDDVNITDEERSKVLNVERSLFIRDKIVQYITTNPIKNKISDIIIFLTTQKETSLINDIVSLHIKYKPERVTQVFINAANKAETNITEFSAFEVVMNELKDINKYKTVTDVISNPMLSFLKFGMTKFGDNSYDISSSLVLNLFFDASGNRRIEQPTIDINNYNGLFSEDGDRKLGRKVKDLIPVDKAIMDINSVILDNEMITFQLSDKSSFYSLNYGTKLINNIPEFVDYMMKQVKREMQTVVQYKSSSKMKDLKILSSNIIDEKGNYQFSIFKDIFSSELTKRLLQGLINEKAIDGLIEINKDEIKSSINKLINDEIKDILNFIRDRSKMDMIPTLSRSKDSSNKADIIKYERNGLDYLSKDLINSLDMFVVNFISSNIELSKLGFGNSYSHDAPFKRLNGYMSKGRIPITDPKFMAEMKASFPEIHKSSVHELFRQEYNKESQFRFKNERKSDNEYRFISIKDSSVNSPYVSEMIKQIENIEKTLNTTKGKSKIDILRKKKQLIEKVYNGIKEGDGAGFTTFDFFRKFSLSISKWSPELEDMYLRSSRWDIAQKKIRILKEKDNLTESDLEKLANLEQELIKNEITVEEVAQNGMVFNTQKLQYYGSIENEEYAETGFHKFGLTILIPQLIKGTNWERYIERMLIEDVDVALFESANKLERNKSQDSFYNFNNTVDTIDDLVKSGTYKISNEVSNNSFNIKTGFLPYLKEQQLIENKTETETTFGSQIRKLLFNFFDNGVPIRSSQEENFKGFKDSLNNIVETELAKLVIKLGLHIDENRNITIVNKKLFVNEVRAQLLKGNADYNIFFALDTNENGDFLHPLDMSTNKKQIVSAIASIINNKLVKGKVPGESKILVPCTGFEKYKEGRNNSVDKGSNDLSYYWVDEKNKVRKTQCKIAYNKKFAGLLTLQHDDGNKIGTLDRLNEMMKLSSFREKYEKQLTLVGYRIPTQEHNSIDILEVVEFLHPLSGKAIMVSAELIAKSGSDFDIDKLNILYPQIDSDGNYISFTEGADRKSILSLLKDVENVNKRIIDVNEKSIKEREEINNILSRIYAKQEARAGVSPKEMMIAKKAIENKIADLELESKELMSAVDMLKSMNMYERNHPDLVNETDKLLKAIFRDAIIRKELDKEAIEGRLLSNGERNSVYYSLNEEEKDKRWKEIIRKGKQELMTENDTSESDLYEIINNMIEDQLSLYRDLEKLLTIPAEEYQAFRDTEEANKSFMRDLADLRKERGRYLSQIDNVTKSHHNKMLDIFSSVILNKDNYIDFITPNSTLLFDNIVDRIVKSWNPQVIDKDGKINLDYKGTKMYKYSVNMSINEIFYQQKKSLGIVASNNGLLPVLQQAGVAYKPKKIPSILMDIRDGFISLGGLYSKTFDENNNIVDGVQKSAIFGQSMNYFLDVASNSILGYANINTESTGLFTQLINSGVDHEVAFAIINQPIIRKYFMLKLLLRNSSIVNDTSVHLGKPTSFVKKKFMEDEYSIFQYLLTILRNSEETKDFTKDIIATGVQINYGDGLVADNEETIDEVKLRNKISSIEEGINVFSLEELMKNIETRDNVNILSTLKQLLILHEVVLIERSARLDVRQIQTTFNWDTKPGNTSTSIGDNQSSTEELENNRNYKGIHNVITNTVISPFNIGYIVKGILNSVSPLVENYYVTKHLIGIKKKKKYGKVNGEKLFETFKNDIVMSVFQTWAVKSELAKSIFRTNFSPPTKANGEQLDINEYAFWLLHNLSTKLMDLQSKHTTLFKRNSFLNDLFIDSSKRIQTNPVINIGLILADTTPETRDRYIGDVREIQELQGEKYKDLRNFIRDLTLLSFYQSGLNKTYLSFINLMDPSVLSGIGEAAFAEFSKDISNESRMKKFLEELISSDADKGLLYDNNEFIRPYKRRSAAYNKANNVESYRFKNLVLPDESFKAIKKISVKPGDAHPLRMTVSRSASYSIANKSDQPVQIDWYIGEALDDIHGDEIFNKMSTGEVKAVIVRRDSLAEEVFTMMKDKNSIKNITLKLPPMFQKNNPSFTKIVTRVKGMKEYTTLSNGDNDFSELSKLTGISADRLARDYSSSRENLVVVEISPELGTKGVMEYLADKIYAGDLFAAGGIPVISINREGKHESGVALSAEKNQLINKDNKDFMQLDGAVTFPVKEKSSDNIDFKIFDESVNKLILLANNNRTTKYVIPPLGIRTKLKNEKESDYNRYISRIVEGLHKILIETDNVILVMNPLTEKDTSEFIRFRNSLIRELKEETVKEVRSENLYQNEENQDENIYVFELVKNEDGTEEANKDPLTLLTTADIKMIEISDGFIIDSTQIGEVSNVALEIYNKDKEGEKLSSEVFSNILRGGFSSKINNSKIIYLGREGRNNFDDISDRTKKSIDDAIINDNDVIFVLSNNKSNLPLITYLLSKTYPFKIFAHKGVDNLFPKTIGTIIDHLISEEKVEFPENLSDKVIKKLKEC